MSSRADTHLTRRRVLAATVTGTALGGLATHFVFAGAARRLLDVHFAALHHQAAAAAGIWMHNATIFLGFVVFLGCAHVLQASQQLGRFERRILRACDGVLCLWATGTSTLAGMLIGAYGTRQISAFLPQAPVEIAAWMLLLVLYVDVRRGRATVAFTVRRLPVILALLALGAVLELWAGA
jgi:hypothetical protein